MCAAAPASSASSATASTDTVPAWHAGFLRLLPAIQLHARVVFRRLKKEAREEAVAEVVANALVAYVRLVERGRQDVAFATPLASYAIAQYHDGRRVGAKSNVRDVTSPSLVTRSSSRGSIRKREFVMSRSKPDRFITPPNEK